MRFFEFVSRLPVDRLRLRRGGKAQFISETGHLSEAFEIPVSAILVAWLMVMIFHIVPRLRLAPRQVMSFELKPLTNRKGRNSHAG